MDEYQENPVPENNESVQPETPKPKVEVEQSPIKSLLDDHVTPDQVNQEYLNLLNVNMKELTALTDNYPNMEGDKSLKGRLWVASFDESIKHLVKSDTHTNSVERDGSEWRQKVDIDGDKIGPGRPRFGSSSSNVISGERALMKASSVLGLGSMVQIPLWHTGIWVSIKAPSEASLLELERRMANEKVSLGRYASGMIFSNTSVYSVSYAVNFVLNHIYDSTAKNITQDALKNIIKVTDIPTLIWGMVCAIYPNGYKYARPCTTNPAECQHIVRGMLNVAKLFWVDNASLNEQQRRHMQRRTEKFGEEELERYENQHVRGGRRTITLREGLRVGLRVPTVAQYENSGFAWVDGIVKLLEGSLGVSLRGQERDDYILDQGRLTALRQYGHWVEHIEVEDDVIEDLETTEELLAMLSSNEELTDSFYEEIGKFIDDSTLALIAIPKYDCPACGGEQHGDVHDKRHPHLLPLDVVRVFFTLHGQRIYEALMHRRL